MKRFTFIATALIALASCSESEFVGENTSQTSQTEQGTITFGSGVNTVTRANFQGAEAAAKLNNNFVVEGIKWITGGSRAEVFDNYNVNWVENTADKTLSNNANWEYVGQPILSEKTSVYAQTIKYWDYAAYQYDFWAYSLGGGSATVTTLAHDASLGTSAYTFTGNADDLSKVYISDLVTAYNPAVSDKPTYQSTINLTFRALVAKIRIGLYETIPGYSVKNVLFYPSVSGTPAATPILFASNSTLPSSGDCTVYFPTTGTSNIANSDYNKAHISFATSGTKTANQSYGTGLNYNSTKDLHEKTNGTIWLNRTAASPSWAYNTTPGEYTIVLPNESGSVLTLKVDYTLEASDGSGEEITVHGATAIIPSQYTQWKSNYAYTYIFKISDNTNGKTDPALNGPVGLYPITFDAVVVNSEEFTQELVTTVATPSINTYSVTSNVTSNNEYTTSDEIYVTATSDGTLIDMDETSHGAILYKVSKAGATEAEVLDALNTYTSLSDGTYVGRNAITLTPVSSGLDLTKTEIPLVDGNKITGLTAGQVALINKSTLTTNTYYAFVYKVNDATPTPTKKYEAVTLAANANATSYFTTNDGTDTQATTNTTAEQTVYDRYYVVNNVEYAIKVIKIQ